MSGVPITVAEGDGIGPEIMRATLDILGAAGADLDIEEIEIGESVFRQGISSGISPEAWDSIRRTRVFLKAPITTPQGGGFKSLNVTVRKSLALFANVRPAISYDPYVRTKHPDMDLVVIRENEEDTYGGIEHRQTDEVYQCLKLITRPGTERIVRYAFEYARAHDRTKVTCFTKDNIMKMTDGLFHKIFDEVAAEYPDIESEHWIVDIGIAKLAATPEQFDVVVVPNLYGDIISDVAAQLSGSVGLAGSANIGDQVAMFEAIHGSAPRRAGQDIANPSGLLLAGVQMLVHIGQGDVGERIHNAWLRTIEEGIHTYDIYDPEVSAQQVGTSDFTRAVIDRLGQRPEHLEPVSYPDQPPMTVKVSRRAPEPKTLDGVDVFLHWWDGSPDDLGHALERVVEESDLQLVMITNRGQTVYPQGMPETFCTDHWRCRFQAPYDTDVTPESILDLLGRLVAGGFDVVKTENLYQFSGQPAYSVGQGQ